MAEQKKVEFGHPRMAARDVHEEVEQVCPIYGVSIGRWGDRSTWRIHFHEDATPEQRQDAHELLQSLSLETHPEYVGAPRVIR